MEAAGPNATNGAQSSAFTDAVQRARQIAAKFQPSGQKRPLEDDDAEEMDRKPGGGGPPMMGGGPPMMGGGPPMMGGGPNIGLGSGETEEIQVPDKMVGLIIGKGGEQIIRLQRDSGAKIQLDDDSGGLPDRKCTVSGTRNAINQCKEMIFELVSRGGDGPGDRRSGGLPGGSTEEISIPGPCVGLIIGKGGETIKQLQEKSGAKMFIIQDGPQQGNEKPLRITGEPHKVEMAKQLVNDLIAESETRAGQFGNRGRGRGGFGGGRGGFGGGRGDRRDEYGGDDQENHRFGGGRGGGRGGFNNDWCRNGPGGSGGHDGPNEKVETLFTVPANKVGLVIGKGGETIKSINQQTGAHCELDRRPPNNPNEKVFIIRGTPEQIDNAKKNIAEKAEMYPMNGPGGPGQNGPGNMGPQGWGNAHQQWNAGHPNDPNKQAGDANAAAWAAYYSQGYGGSQNQNSAGPPGGGQQVPHNATPPASGHPAQGGGQPDYSAQWSDYYRSMGMHREAEAIEAKAKGMKNGGAQPGAPGVPQQGGGGAPSPSPAAGGPAAASGGAPGGGGAQDYSQQWIEYYRSQGKHAEADKIAQMSNQGFQPGY